MYGSGDHCNSKGKKMAAYTGNPIVNPDEMAFEVTTDFGAATEEIVVNTTDRTIALKVIGNLTTDGATFKAVYSKIKDAWRVDAELIKYPFPFIPITDEQFELRNGWTWDKSNTSGAAGQTTEELLRTGGWQVVNDTGVETEKWMSIISLGTLGSTDQAYFVQGADRDPVNFTLTGIVNEAVKVYASTGLRSDISFDDVSGNIEIAGGDVSSFAVADEIVVTGSASNDGVYTVTAVNTGTNQITVAEALVAEAAGASVSIVTDYRKYFKLFVREWFKSYAQAAFEDIGVDTSVTGDGATFQAYRFPLTNSTDANLSVNEVDIDANSDGIPDIDPYDKVSITYLRDANGTIFNVIGEIQGNTAYTVGDVVYYPTDGNWYNVIADHTSVATPDPSGDAVNYALYTGQRSIGGQNYPFTVIIDGDTTAGSNGNTTLGEIYEAVQYKLRQSIDIDESAGDVIGKTADELLQFIGDTLVTSQGVFIDSYRAVDTNNIEMNTWDITVATTEIAKTFPYVAALTVGFGANLTADANAKYWVFFENANGNQYGTSSAIIVQDAELADMAGDVSGRTSVNHSFAYSSNVQGGRTADTDANIVAVAIGLETGQYVSAPGVIAKSVSNTVQLTAALERNYTQGTVFP